MPRFIMVVILKYRKMSKLTTWQKIIQVGIAILSAILGAIGGSQLG